jgi:hypothetical protein
VEHAGVIADWLAQPQVLISYFEIDPGVAHPQQHCNVRTATSAANCA